MPVTRQQRVFYKTFSQHGSGTAMVEIEPKDVVLLIHIAYLDIFENEPDWFSEPFYQLAKESFGCFLNDGVFSQNPLVSSYISGFFIISLLHY